jgi:ataxia telangiectasia mutated family protein
VSTRRLSPHAFALTLTGKLEAATSVKDNGDHLKELIEIIKYNRGRRTLETLGNKAYTALCEILFEKLDNERQVVLVQKKRKATDNLILCAIAIRHVIVSAVRTVKVKTVTALIDLMIETQPRRDEPRTKPLLEEFPRVLRVLLEHQPHVERLSLAAWEKTVDFCIGCLADSSKDVEVEASNSWSTNLSGRGRTPFDSTDASIARGSPHEPLARTKSVPDEMSRSTDDLIHCLLALVTATNAPVFKKAEAIMTALLYFLKRRHGRGKLAAAALAGINAILARIALQKLDLSKRTIKELLPLMKVMWSEQVLRDEMLITLSYTEAHVSSLVADIEDTTTCSDLEAVLDTMYTDYRTRKETTMQQYLEEDHLCFRHLGAADVDTHPLHTLVFSLDTEHVKSEGLWATVHAIARFSSMLDKRKRKMAPDREADGESVPKRARIDFLFDEYARHLAEPRSNAKRAALQVISFMVQEAPVDEERLRTLTERLTSCISDENAANSAWAMLALTA